jgi:substrate import-associated zinc metallohydrolase lipoprotein
MSFCFAACSKDNLSSESVITVDKNVSNTPFDKWLVENFQTPYNITIDWRWNENEIMLGNYTIPADYNSAIILAHILKHCCLEAYDEAAGINFTRHNFPKQLVFIGSWQYNNNNSRTLGTAEGGRKIWLLGVNEVLLNINSIAKLNKEYLKTMHHEFQHILNQTTPYSTAYKELTKTTYLADSWSTSPNNVGYLQRGYISDYAQKNDKEDFAEIYSIYVTSTEETWQSLIDQSIIVTENANGTTTYDYTYRDILLKKLDIVRNYMLKTWHVDMDVMRKVLHRRTKDIVDGKVDLTDLTINNN